MSISERGGPVREVTFLDKQLAEYILAHSLCDQNLVARGWFAWLKRSLRQWPVKRYGIIHQNPYSACFDYLSKHSGDYCEGLYINNLIDIPELAIWAVNDDGLHCFSHDLTLPHSLHGNIFGAQQLQTLRKQLVIEGPYSFSENPDVFKSCGIKIAHSVLH